ncbi:MAG: class I SAM-dependent methyltransferase [Desulfobacterales bacterium]|nr:class I SAM-dependent methyltransferase [Desulfobacterales bacterium]
MEVSSAVTSATTLNIKEIAGQGLAFTGRLLQWVPERLCVSILAALAWLLAAGRGSKAGLRLLLQLNNQVYALTGKLACDYGDGLHPKHRLMAYHDFFVTRLKRGESVIDIGCGNGALAYDMAAGGAIVTAVELNEASFIEAKKKYSHERVRYVHGDVLKDLPDESFDVAVMSNVLEHLEDRVGFLKKAQLKLNPKRWLIRVPLYERDWRVPLMEELGVDYRLDSTHYIEYTQESFAEEMEQAGLEIVHKETRWGEIWCEARLEKGEESAAILRSEL